MSRSHLSLVRNTPTASSGAPRDPIFAAIERYRAAIEAADAPGACDDWDAWKRTSLKPAAKRGAIYTKWRRQRYSA